MPHVLNLVTVKQEKEEERDIPDRSWKYVPADFFFSYKDKNYLLIVDMYSKCPEIIHYNNTTHLVIIKHFKACFHDIGNRIYYIVTMAHNSQIIIFNSF